jgi:hypothetical protein
MTGAIVTTDPADVALTISGGGTPNVVAAAYTNNVPGGMTTLYAIDATTDRVYMQGGADGTPSPNGGVLTALAGGPISNVPNFDGLVGYDIGVGNDDGYAVLHEDGSTSSELWAIQVTVNDVIGTLIGTVSVEEPLIASALATS